MPSHQCVRVYNNGDRVHDTRSAQAVGEWLEYNRIFRFGCALFIDGECKAQGYLSDERCQAIAEELSAKLATPSSLAASPTRGGPR